MADPYHHYLNFSNSCAIDSFLELAQFSFFHDITSKEKGKLLSLVANTCALRCEAGKNVSKKLLFDIREVVWQWIESNCKSFYGRTANASFEEILDHICTTSDEFELFSVVTSYHYSCSSTGCDAFIVREKKQCPVYVTVPQLNNENYDLGATLSSMFFDSPSKKLVCENCQVRSLECNAEKNVVALPTYLFVRVPTVNGSAGGVQQLVVMDGIIIPELINLSNGQKYILRGAVRGIGRHFTTAVKIADNFVHFDGNRADILIAPSLSELSNAVKLGYSSVTDAPESCNSDVHLYQTKSSDGYFVFLFCKDSSKECISNPRNISHSNENLRTHTQSHTQWEAPMEGIVVPNIPLHNSYDILADEAGTQTQTLARGHSDVTPVRAQNFNRAKEKTKRKLIESSPHVSKKQMSNNNNRHEDTSDTKIAKEGPDPDVPFRHRDIRNGASPIHKDSIRNALSNGHNPKVKVSSSDFTEGASLSQNSNTEHAPSKGYNANATIGCSKSSRAGNASVPLNDITNVSSQPRGAPLNFCDNLIVHEGRLFLDIQVLNSMNLLAKDWRPSRLLKRVQYYGLDSTTEVIGVKSISHVSLKLFIVLLFKSSVCEQTIYQNTCRQLLSLLNKASLEKNNMKWKNFSVHSNLDENRLYVDMSDLYKLLNVKVKRIRYFLHVLKRLGMTDDHFIFEKNVRRHISFEAFTAVLLTHVNVSKQKLLHPTADILDTLEMYFLCNFDTVCKDFHTKMLDRDPHAFAGRESKQSQHPDNAKKDKTGYRETKSSCGRSTFDILSPPGNNLKCNRTVKRRIKKQHCSLKQFASAVHKGGKESLKQAFIYDINQSRSSPSSHEVEWTGHLNSDDLIDILKGVPSVDSKYDNLFDEVACDHASKKFRLSASEVISIIDSNNANSITKNFRERLPLFFDKPKKMQTEWKQLKHEFNIIMRPQPLSNSLNNGYRVDPQRLIRCLRHLYYFLPECEWWKVWGDGREIGGKKSCSIALSCINNEMALHGMQFHSPSDIWPLCIRYGGDGRWSLEDAIGTEVGEPGWLNDWIEKEQLTNNSLFFLAGDSMFLDAVHGMKGEFAPNKTNGFNIYSTDAKEQKHETCLHTGFRSGLNKKINRILKHSLLESIPLHRTVFCIDHACTRIVEKLLELKIKSLCSQKSVAGESCGKDYFISKLDRLKQNMVERCVTKGNRIDCNPDGSLKEKISLNKIDAHALLLPCYDGCCYGPLLEGVSSEYITFHIDVVLQRALEFNSSESEFKVENALWNCFSKVTFLLRDSDPPPILRPGSHDNSLDVNDFSWGMSADKIQDCIFNLDLFHKLFVLLYGGDKLTPYMMKVIDVTGDLLRNLPVPTLMRFSTEGGEHLHYTDATYFHQHTQKGGSGKTEDPTYAIMCHKYRLLKSRLVEYSKHPDAKRAQAGRDFLKWVDEELAHNASKVALENQISPTFLLLQGIKKSPVTPVYNFHFVGRVPAMLFKNSTISSKDALVEKLHSCRSRVLDLTIDQLPKPSHQKKIIMLTQQSQCHLKMPPKALILACKRSWPIVDFAFAFNYIKDPLTDINSFLLDIKNIQSHPLVRLSRPFSSLSMHKKSHVVTTYKKMVRKKANLNIKRVHKKKKKSVLLKPGSSFALFVCDAYKTLTKEQLRLPIRDRQRLISKRWRELPLEEKSRYAFRAKERYNGQLQQQLPDAKMSNSVPFAYERNQSLEH